MTIYHASAAVLQAIIMAAVRAIPAAAHAMYVQVLYAPTAAANAWAEILYHAADGGYSLKHTGKIAVGGIISALALAVMFASYFPYLTYAVPAIAGTILIVIVIEIDFKWAMLVYAVIAVLSMFLMEPEAKILFTFFFGYYPVLKFKVDKIRFKVVRWITKFAIFNAAIVLAYLVFIFISRCR